MSAAPRSPPHSSILWGAIPRTDAHVTALDPDFVTAPPLAESVPEPLPAGWVGTIADLRAAARAPYVAAPSGIGASALGIAPASPSPNGVDGVAARVDRAGQRAGGPPARGTAARSVARCTPRSTRSCVRGLRPDPAAVASACDRAALEEGIWTQRAEVGVRVTSALATDLLQEALAAPRRWSELYLAAPVDRHGVELVEGFADLVFESPEGLVLVDYKTDATIDEQARAHYREQLGSYADLLLRATGQRVARVCLLHARPESASVIDLEVA